MEENYATWRKLKSFKGVEFNNLGEYRDRKTGKPIKKRAYWRPIKGYPDYEISNFGEIISNKCNKRIRLKQSKNGSGYYAVSLYKNKNMNKLLVHRLVAENFIENKYKNHEVNHVDANKLNNNVTNLEWVTRERNMQHAWTTGLMENARKAVSIMKELNKKPIYSKKLDINFNSTVDAATYLQTHYFENSTLDSLKTGIRLLLTNQIKKSKFDFGWEYILRTN